MANQRVTFRRGPKATIPNTKVPGTLLIATDTGEAYLDDTETTRIQLVDSTKLSLSGGTLQGDLNLSGHRIINIESPTSNNDVVNKSYVDTQITNISDSISGYLPLSGGTMTGTINMGNHSITNVNNPTNTNDVANKSYVDTSISSLSNSLKSLYLPLSGGTLSGTLNLSNNRIMGVGTPTSNNDAVNKSYVDNYITGAGSTIAKNNLTESRVVVSDTSGKINVSSVTTTELGYLSGVTSSIQTQLNNKANSSHTHSYLPLSGGTMSGAINLGTNKLTNLATPTSSTDATNKQYVDSQVATKQNTITGAASTIASSNLTSNRVTISDNSGKIGISDITTTELNYLDNVTSNIQTQLNNKLSLSGGTMTGDINLGTHKITNLGTPTSNTDAATKSYVDTAVANVSGGVSGAYLPLTGGTMSGEISMGNNKITNISTPTQNTDAVNKQYVDTQITSAQPNITGAASSIITSNLTASRALVSDTNGKVAVSAVTSTELGYLDGVTSNVQTQLNGKAATNHTHSYLPLSGGTLSGALSLNNNKITNLATPTSNSDAVNKSYVDTAIAGVSGGITGAYLPLSGGTMTGDINLNSNKVTGLPVPTTSSDAATKSYVDTQVSSKQNTITGGASTITTSNLTASRVLVSDNNGKVAVSAVTSTELGYLDGVTSSIQTQLNGKSSSSHTHSQYLPLAGGTMTGNINMNNHEILNYILDDGSID